MKSSLLITTMMLSVTACGPAAGTRAQDMSAQAHRDEAAYHYGRSSAATGPYRLWGSYYYTPWHYGWYPYDYYWNTATSYHLRTGDQHLAAAKQLEADLAEACSLVPIGLETQSPLFGFIASIEDQDTTVVLHMIPEAGPPDRLLNHIRCHRAWMAVEGLERMVDDPLALRGLTVLVRATESGIDVLLGVPDAGQLPELHRRAEAAARHERTR